MNIECLTFRAISFIFFLFRELHTQISYVDVVYEKLIWQVI